MLGGPVLLGDVRQALVEERSALVIFTALFLQELRRQGPDGPAGQPDIVVIEPQCRR